MAADNDATTQAPPPLPDGWTRCHEYMSRKNRYCRQTLVKKTLFCGNHQPPSSSERIPCPLDPSHYIKKESVEKHILVCPFQRKIRQQQEQSYYRANVNTGGHGSRVCSSEAATPSDKQHSLQWAQHFALKILQAHQQVFTRKQLTQEDVNNLSLDDICNAIPSLDLSIAEVDGGLEHAVEHYRIKSGGARHLAQQASLVGHLRRIDVFDQDSETVTLLEMGAGRGMLGLMAAGVAAKTTCTNAQLVLVERAGSRAKADCVLRMAKDETNYMALNRVDFSRIQCDLAHVHMPTVVSELASTTTNAENTTMTSAAGTKRKHVSPKEKTVVIAKHLCGAGTDLALKSLQGIQVDACVMATCCHGVCSWQQYVGRDFMKSIFGDDCGQAEFLLLRRWASGTVLCDGGKDKKEDEEEETPEHGMCAVDDGKDPMSVSAIIQSLGLESVGPQGLGRACQRLLDQGRLEYMREVLLEEADKSKVEMFHYVPSSVTPQNAVLVARRLK